MKDQKLQFKAVLWKNDVGQMKIERWVLPQRRLRDALGRATRSNMKYPQTTVEVRSAVAGGLSLD